MRDPEAAVAWDLVGPCEVLTVPDLVADTGT